MHQDPSTVTVHSVNTNVFYINCVNVLLNILPKNTINEYQNMMSLDYDGDLGLLTSYNK